MSGSAPRLTLGLAALFAVQSVGFAGIVWRQGSPLASAAFQAGMSEGLAERLDRGAAGLVLIAAILMVGAWNRRMTLIAGAGAAGWMAIVSLADAVQGGHFAAELAPAAHAVRWATPAMVAALAYGLPRVHALRVLRLAAGAVFVAHGMECLLAHPTFIDFLIAVPDRFLGVRFEQSTATWLLVGIGVVDVVCGIGLIVGGWWWFAFWMAFWGFLTALVRVLYFGEPGWPDALIRVTNGGIPFIIGWWRWHGLYTDRPLLLRSLLRWTVR